MIKVTFIGVRRNYDLKPERLEVLRALNTDTETEVRFVKLEDGSKVLYKNKQGFYNREASQLTGFVIQGNAIKIENKI